MINHDDDDYEDGVDHLIISKCNFVFIYINLIIIISD